MVRGLILMQVTTRASSDVHKRAWLRPIIAKQAGIPSEITIGARNAAQRRPPSSRDATPLHANQRLDDSDARRHSHSDGARSRVLRTPRPSSESGVLPLVSTSGALIDTSAARSSTTTNCPNIPKGPRASRVVVEKRRINASEQGSARKLEPEAGYN